MLARVFGIAALVASIVVGVSSAAADDRRLPLSSITTSAEVEREVVILDSNAAPTQYRRYSLQEIGSSDSNSSHGTIVTLSGRTTGLFKHQQQLHHVELRDEALMLSAVNADDAQPDGQGHNSDDLHLHSKTCQSAVRSGVELQEYATERAERSEPTVLRSGGAIREIELVAVAPGDFVAGRSEKEAIDDIIFAVEGANVFYRTLGLRISLKAIQIFSPGPNDPYAFAAESQNALTMLDRLRAEWLFREVPSRDVTMVFAGSSFRQVFGLAYPAASCIFPEFSYGFVSKGGSVGAQSRANLASTLAHEVGHIIGMSHDSTLTAVGPTVMWPTFSSSPAGFSSFSINEFFDHEKNGGASCFAERQVVSDSNATPVQFGATLRLTVSEGETLSLQFVDPSQPLVTYYIAQGLPEGAVFDPSSGFFHYTPGASVVDAAGGSRELRFSIGVLGNASLPMEVVLTVVDANSPPRINFSTAEQLAVQRGSAVSVGISAEDLDLPSDTVILGLSNFAQASRYPGRPSIFLQGTVGSINWIPSAEGSYEFRFFARDSSGVIVTRTLRVVVQAANQKPVIEVPDQIQLQGTQSFFTINAFDPENQPIYLHVDGIAPGVLIERFGNSWRVDFSNTNLGKKELLLNLSVTDGQAVAKKEVRVSVEALAAAQTATWPGVARGQQSGVGGGLFFYNGISGMWQMRSCEGVLADEFQFGGLVGDKPLMYQESGVKYAALYRVVDGAGFFILKIKDEVRHFAWGLAGDIPLLADFDGDGISDLAVYRPATGQWLVSFSTGLASQTLSDMSGWSGAQTPFAQDVDGDGLADRVLVIRGATGEVFADVRLATGRQLLIGIADVGIIHGAEAIVGDVDSDGRADFLVRSTSGALMGIRSNTLSAFEDSEFSQGARVVSTNCSFGEYGGLSAISRYKILAENQVPTFFPENSIDGELLELYQLRQLSGANRRPIADVDGDYRSDLTVWRPQSSRGIGSWYSNRSTAGSYQSPWEYGDIVQPVPFRFEEHRGEVLVHFESGVWRFSGPGVVGYEVPWGIAGDIAVPGDYNGDSYTDLAVYRPSDGSWWIAYGPTFGPAVRIDFGAPGDIPVPADFDGDGALELAVYRPSLSAWFIRFADGDVITKSFGLPGVIPIAADFLGEGRAQIAVWRPITGMWYLMRNDSEVVSRQWGLPGDIPVALDRDGDGRSELGVWRPSDGTWYSRMVRDGNDAVYLTQYGLPGDLPVGPLWTPTIEDGLEIVQ